MFTIALLIVIFTVLSVIWLERQQAVWIKKILDWFPAILFAYVIPATFTHTFGWDLSKVDHEKLKNSKATFVFGQMNQPPGARARVALSGLTVAEYYRDGDLNDPTGGRDILFFSAF